MRSFGFLIFSLLLLSGCSDLGPEIGVDWASVDLPYGQILLPPELERHETAPGIPGNPEYHGIVEGYTLQVQLCISAPVDAGFREYEESTISHFGRKVVLFRGIGVFHLYDSHFSRIVGARAHFGPNGEVVVVTIRILQPEAEPLARQILLTLRP